MDIENKIYSSANKSWRLRILAIVLTNIVSILFSITALGEPCANTDVMKGIVINQTILEKDSNNRIARLDLAKCFFMANVLNQVDQQIEILLLGNESDINVLLLKAAVSYRKKEWELAKVQYLRVLEIDSQNPESNYMLSNICSALKEFENAKLYMEQYKELTRN